MAKLEAEDAADPSLSPMEEKKIEELNLKPTNRSLVNLASEATEPNSETSSIAPEDEVTLVNSTSDVKSRQPRKLIEEEKRGTGRIAWPIWKMYLSVSEDNTHANDSHSEDRFGVRYSS